jgi:hypothetical protein
LGGFGVQEEKSLAALKLKLSELVDNGFSFLF